MLAYVGGDTCLFSGEPKSNQTQPCNEKNPGIRVQFLSLNPFGIHHRGEVSIIVIPIGVHRSLNNSLQIIVIFRDAPDKYGTILGPNDMIGSKNSRVAYVMGLFRKRGF